MPVPIIFFNKSQTDKLSKGILNFNHLDNIIIIITFVQEENLSLGTKFTTLLNSSSSKTSLNRGNFYSIKP